MTCNYKIVNSNNLSLNNSSNYQLAYKDYQHYKFTFYNKLLPTLSSQSQINSQQSSHISDSSYISNNYLQKDNYNYDSNFLEQYWHNYKVRKALSISSTIELADSNLQIPASLCTLFQLKEKNNQNLIYPQMPTREQYLKRVESLKMQPKQSQFHNKQKVMINKITKFFLQKQLDQQINIPKKLYRKICKFIECVRESGHSSNGQIKRYDSYNQSHFHVLFLQIKQNSLAELQANKRDVQIHKLVFNIDLEQINSSDLKQNREVNFINFLKHCVFSIYKLHLERLFIGTPEQREERKFEIRASAGFNQMIQGIYVHRF